VTQTASAISLDILREVIGEMQVSTLDIPAARTLPAECYTSEELFQFELENIFFGGWMCVGHITQLKEPGDYFVIKIGDELILTIMDEEKKIRSLSPICQHRGFPILEEGCGNVSRLRCPYHWWAYNLSGDLTAAPEMQKTYDIEMLRNTIKLPQFSVEIWQGLIFVNVSNEAAPLAPTLKKLDDAIAGYEMSEMRGTAAIDYTEQPWNWKSMHENALEPYHTSFIHRGYHDMLPARNAEFWDWDDGDGQVMHPTYFQEGASGFNPTHRALFPIIEGLDKDQRSRLLFVSILPTAFLAFGPDQVFLFLILPEDANHITLRINWLFPEKTWEDPNFDWKYDLQLNCNDVANQQDIDTNAAMHRGLKSRFAPRGRYAHLEQTLPQFNRWLLSRYESGLKHLETETTR
jgi:phenylpropionate dioxygenase-like ring-hydroxylating dioxygenase large terminal subunit